MTPNIDEEARIVWLQPRERYAYLREGVAHLARRIGFPKSHAPNGKATDGGNGTHLVAYAELRSDARNIGIPGYFARRYWWVKSYDRFDGHRDKDYYEMGAPSEAVDPDTIYAGRPTEGWTEDSEKEKVLAA